MTTLDSWCVRANRGIARRGKTQMRQAPNSRSIAQGGQKSAAHSSVWLALLVVAACSVDDRALTADDATGGLGSAGGSGVGLGDAGAGGEAPFPLCDYSGSAGDPGCETLVENPGFAVNAAGWVAEDLGVMESREPEDANKKPDSGSLAVINSNYSDVEGAKAGTAGGGARQCLSLNGGGTVLDFAADVFIPKGQGAGYMGNTYVSVAALSVFFYTDVGCTGQNSSSFTSHAVQIEDEWVHVAESTRVPNGAHSMAVRLATLKPFRQFTFQAQFDNIFVRER